MTVVAVAPLNVASFPEGGGHFWVYMQYVEGLRALGCDVYWIERIRPRRNPRENEALAATFRERMERFGLRDRAILYGLRRTPTGGLARRFLVGSAEALERAAERTELLLNFDYTLPDEELRRFRRTALVDIDPGLLQHWITVGELEVARHDLYFTIGETVGRPGARIPDCGLPWVRIRPPVSLEQWPCALDPAADALTTVSSWWGGSGRGEWVTTEGGGFYENNKRVTFLEFVGLPGRVDQPLELALDLGSGRGDARDRAVLEAHGWLIRHAREVAGGAEAYRRYIQSSRGEFACVKPSCIRLQNAWISDRTICYLASGKPAIVQDTGPSDYLPNGEGLFRFSTLDEAAEAVASVNRAYVRHCRAARELAETYFESKAILGRMLDSAAKPPDVRPAVAVGY